MFDFQKRTCLILRGLPGSGKTSLAQYLKSTLSLYSNLVVSIHSADAYMVTGLGDYKFDPSRLSECHDKCFSHFCEALAAKHYLVILHNTSTTSSEYSRYIEAAQASGYNVVSAVLENIHGSSSVHNVPQDTMDKMRSRFELNL